jgi:hypothetical protein
MSYTRTDLVRAGQILVDEDRPRSEQVWAAETLGEWRAAHAPLLESFEVGIRKELTARDPNALLAHRLKRTPSIVAKLRKMQELKLPSMQDIGGIRAVVRDMEVVREMEEFGCKPVEPLVLARRDNYIATPKPSGYRSSHFIYRNGPPPPGDGTFQFELQIRTRLQHAWATAIETVDALEQHAQKHSLKSGLGPPEWLEYFALAGAAFAFHEGCEPSEAFRTAGRVEIYRRTIEETRRLFVRERLRNFTAAIQSVVPGGPDDYYLLQLFPEERRTVTQTYSRDELPAATAEYLRLEERAKQGEALLVALVAAGTVENLRQAYPNYFMDSQEFVKILDLIEKG